MKFFVAVLAVLVAAAVFAMPAMASEVDIKFIERATGNEYGTQTNPVQMCSGPITGGVKGDVAIKVANVGPSTDTYAFSLQDMPAGWTGQIQPDVMLASGESKMLDLFVVNTYYTEPGTYFFTIKAVSGTDGSYVIPLKRIQADILPCYTLQMTDQINKDVCQEAGGDVNYTVSLKNTGKYSENYDLSASSPSAKLQQGSISLAPNQSANFMVTVSSAGVQGIQSVDIVAKSRTSQASATAKLGLNVKDCYSSDAAIEPSEATGCVGKASVFKLTIRNTGLPDSYSVSVPAWAKADAASVLVENGASREITITAIPEQPGKSQLDASVSSSSDKPSIKIVSAQLDTNECRDIVVIASPASTTLCRGGMAAYDVTVKNRGVLEDTITMSASAGFLNFNKVTLASGQSKTVQLNVDTSSLEAGKNTVEITASDGKVSDKSSVDVNVEDCYASKVEISPENSTACPFAKFNYTIKLTNTGKQPDSYTVKFKDIVENASLASGESASWDIPAYSEESGVYSLTVAAQSEHSSSNASAVLMVQQLGKCYAVSLNAEKSARAYVNEAKTANITVKNTGSVADEYAISVEGPGWAYVSPDKVTLEPGVRADVYLYVSPPKEADNSSVKITVNAKSNYAAASIVVTALMGKATLPEGGFSISNITGSIIYESGDMPFWKVAAIAIIALAIIIILVVRFALLVKG